MSGENIETILGLDLGANSVGWALIECVDGRARRILGMGSRIFEAAIEGDLEKGQEESRAVERRMARQMRRQHKRRVMRMIRVGELLQQAGWFPPGNLRDSVERDRILKELDKSLRQQYADRGFHLSGIDAIRGIAYFLRARALDEPLEPYALGRAIYHLAMRRGFLSNRKAPMKKDEELGAVKQGISELEREMKQCQARTLGEYFYKVDPVYEKRIRKRWTARQMYKDEFDTILQQQVKLGAIRDDPKFFRKLRKAIFRQRPLKSQCGLIGPCQFEKNEKRAPWHNLLAQEFRLLQKINDLRLIDPSTREERPLNAEERKILYDWLMEHGEATFAELRKKLGFNPRDGQKFNLEAGDETRLKGNEVAARLIAVLGEERWRGITDQKKAQLISELNSDITEERLRYRAKKVWGITDPERVDKLVKLTLPKGYCSLSKKALKKLVPLMREGKDYVTAAREVYGDLQYKNQTFDRLPPFLKVDRTQRSPVVIRTLSEARKVVNEILRVFGRPDRIHIELAREMKQSRIQRQKRYQTMRDREKMRNQARQSLQAELGWDPNDIKGRDIEKWLLAEECGWVCPYSGKPINYHNLFGEKAEFDIEHIIPYSKSLDDSFVNKTLCHREWNQKKGNRTPAQAFKNTPEWETMLQRVRAFKPLHAVHMKKGESSKHNPKYDLFCMEEIPPDYVDNKLNDTRHAAKVAMGYLGLLYPREERLKRVKAFAGGVTGELRKCWKLNSILGDPDSAEPKKNRADHRHHAIDALVLALATPGMVQYLSKAAEQQLACQRSIRGYQKFMEDPWPHFLEDVRKAVNAIVVSHRVDHRLQGRLHNDTLYSPPRVDENGKTYHVVRKPLDGNFKKVGDIEDPEVRRIVQEHLAAHDGDPKKAFNDPDKHPKINDIPIHAVRVRDYVKPEKIGKDFCPRYALTDSNHHMEIIEEKDKKGNPRWTAVVVSRFEAMQRKIRGEPIIQRNHGEGKIFVCSIATGDMALVDLEPTNPNVLVRVRGISFNEVSLVRANDARQKKEIVSSGDFIRKTPLMLQKMNFRKVSVSPIGEVYPAND